MPLLVYNITGMPVTLDGLTVVVPASAAPPARGPAVNVTSELSGLNGGQFAALEVQRPATLEYEWTADAEYATPGLTVGGLTSANATAVNQSTSLKAQEHHSELLAPGTAIHAQFAAGMPINANAGFTIPFPRRTVQLVFGAMSAAVDVTVTGTDITGAALVEVFNHAGGAATLEGARAFETITLVTSNIDPGDTVDLQTGAGFATAQPFSALDALGVNGVAEAAASSHGATGTVVPTTAPDGARDFTVRYTYGHTHVQNAHAHNFS